VNGTSVDAASTANEGLPSSHDAGNSLILSDFPGKVSKNDDLRSDKIDGDDAEPMEVAGSRGDPREKETERMDCENMETNEIQSPQEDADVLMETDDNQSEQENGVITEKQPKVDIQEETSGTECTLKHGLIGSQVGVDTSGLKKASDHELLEEESTIEIEGKENALTAPEVESSSNTVETGIQNDASVLTPTIGSQEEVSGAGCTPKSELEKGLFDDMNTNGLQKESESLETENTMETGVNPCKDKGPTAAEVESSKSSTETGIQADGNGTPDLGEQSSETKLQVDDDSVKSDSLQSDSKGTENGLTSQVEKKEEEHKETEASTGEKVPEASVNQEDGSPDEVTEEVNQEDGVANKKAKVVDDSQEDKGVEITTEGQTDGSSSRSTEDLRKVVLKQLVLQNAGNAMEMNEETAAVESPVSVNQIDDKPDKCPEDTSGSNVNIIEEADTNTAAGKVQPNPEEEEDQQEVNEENNQELDGEEDKSKSFGTAEMKEEADSSDDDGLYKPYRNVAPSLRNQPACPPKQRSWWSTADTDDYLDRYPGKEDNPHLKANLEFYMNKRKSKPDGDYIDQIHKKWKFQYDLLEEHHGYIQWLFPIRESGLNWHAQELQLHEAEAICKDKKAHARVLESYKMMLGFYGMKLTDDKTGTIARAENWKERYANLNRAMHNYLRITRILKCLGELGYEHLKNPFVSFCINEAFVTKALPNVAKSCREYWIYVIRDEKQRRELEDLVSCLSTSK
jgi:hypothetical protein